MMSKQVEPSAPWLTRKLIIQMALGAVTGAVTMMAALAAIDAGLASEPTGEQVFSVAVGVIYVLMGLFVGFGAILPSLGAKLLNVADADELRDEKVRLLAASVTCLLFGSAMIVLAMASNGGPIGAPVALGVLASAIVLSTILWLRNRHREDEFQRLLGASASQTGLGLISLVFGGWAALAHLGYAAMFTPLVFVAGTLALVLVGAFVVVFQRGLLVR